MSLLPLAEALQEQPLRLVQEEAGDIQQLVAKRIDLLKVEPKAWFALGQELLFGLLFILHF
jgi:hypothetical protein